MDTPLKPDYEPKIILPKLAHEFRKPAYVGYIFDVLICISFELEHIYKIYKSQREDLSEELKTRLRHCCALSALTMLFYVILTCMCDLFLGELYLHASNHIYSCYMIMMFVHTSIYEFNLRIYSLIACLLHGANCCLLVMALSMDFYSFTAWVKVGNGIATAHKLLSLYVLIWKGIITFRRLMLVDATSAIMIIHFVSWIVHTICLSHVYAFVMNNKELFFEGEDRNRNIYAPYFSSMLFIVDSTLKSLYMDRII